MTMKSYRVLIADDHALVRRGIRMLLESQPGVQVCGEASTGTEAVDYVKKEKPDLLVLDLTLPDMNGLEVMRAIREASPSTDVLFLTMHSSAELAQEVLRCGALGYVLKSDADTEFLAALDNVRHRQPFCTNRLTISMADSALLNSPLTPREVQVLQLLAGGKSNKEIASTLGVSPRTIDSHRNHIMHKLKFPSLAELISFAVRNKFIP
jgi:two-component system response regulator NreC